MSKQRLNGEDNVKHFAMIPNMADDDLDPFQYRLYGHYRRVCGEHGECWESTRTTAKMTKMSVGKVVETRRELHALGYITIEEVDSETLHITIKNVWAQNAKRYAERSPHERSVHHMNAKRSPHEPKNNQEKNNQEESIAADAAHVDTSSVGGHKPMAQKTPTPQTPRPRDFMFDAVAQHVFQIDPAEANGSGARIAKISRWLTQSYKGKDAAKVGTISKAAKPEHVAMFAKWYHGKYNASIPRDLEKFVEHWRAFATEMRGKQATPAISQEELDTLARQQSAALLEADYE